MTVALLTPVKLNGTGVIVADPCYHPGAQHMYHYVDQIHQGGNWKTEISCGEIPGWGNRTLELAVVHSTFQESHTKSLVGYAGVDSGQMSICGYLDVPRFANPDDYGPQGFQPADHAGLFDYQGVCDITLNSGDRGGVLCDVMAVSETGCGDGSYPVFVWRDQNDRATKILVCFDEIEEEEVEEYEEEADDDAV